MANPHRTSKTGILPSHRDIGLAERLSDSSSLAHQRKTIKSTVRSSWEPHCIVAIGEYPREVGEEPLDSFIIDSGPIDGFPIDPHPRTPLCSTMSLGVERQGPLNPLLSLPSLDV